MTETRPLRLFFRQCCYALGFFAGMAMLGEWMVPGSVAPFLDPVPPVLLALFLLGLDVMA